MQVASVSDLKRFLFFASFSRFKEANISWSPEMESIGVVLYGALVGYVLDVTKHKGALFLVPANSRSPKWTGVRPPKNVRPQGNAAPERQTTKIFQKSHVQKTRNFRPLKTNGRADVNQKKHSLILVLQK